MEVVEHPNRMVLSRRKHDGAGLCNVVEYRRIKNFHEVLAVLRVVKYHGFPDGGCPTLSLEYPSVTKERLMSRIISTPETVKKSVMFGSRHGLIGGMYKRFDTNAHLLNSDSKRVSKCGKNSILCRSPKAQKLYTDLGNHFKDELDSALSHECDYND